MIPQLARLTPECHGVEGTHFCHGCEGTRDRCRPAHRVAGDLRDEALQLQPQPREAGSLNIFAAFAAFAAFGTAFAARTFGTAFGITFAAGSTIRRNFGTTLRPN